MRKTSSIPTPILVSLALLPMLACDPDVSFNSGPLVTAGLANPVGEEIPDSINTVTRRVWYGPDVEVVGAYPFPDAGMLSLTDWSVGELATRNLETRETSYLTSHNPSPYETGMPTYTVVSPDGGMVAYDWLDWAESGPAVYSLRVVDVSTRRERVLWAEAGWWIRPYAWFPDGASVLAIRVNVQQAQDDPQGGGGELVRIGVRDGSVEILSELYNGIETAAVSRDGRFVTFDQRPSPGEPFAIRRLRVSDGSLETLLSGPEDLHLYGWSPDTDHVLFWTERGGTPGLWIVPVQDGRVAGSVQLVLPGAWNLSPLGFASEGRFFYRVLVGSSNLYVATLSDDYGAAITDATPTVPVTPARLAYPDWSPDGRLLAYIEDRRVMFGVGGPPPDLVLRDVQTGEARAVALSDGLEPMSTPRWMPDGRSLLLHAQRGADRGIYRVDPQTGEADAVVTNGVDHPIGVFGVSPDGRFLYYRKTLGGFGSSDHRLFRRNLADGTEAEVAGGKLAPGLCREPHPAPCLFWDLAVSPDGEMLAVNMRGSLAVMNVDGTGRRQLASSADVNSIILSVTWTPDGESLLFTRLDQWVGDLTEPEVRENIHTVYRVDVAGGEPERVELGTDELIGGQALGSPRFHPDGRRLVFVAGEVRSELWMMEGFLPETVGNR